MKQAERIKHVYKYTIFFHGDGNAWKFKRNINTIRKISNVRLSLQTCK